MLSSKKSPPDSDHNLRAITKQEIEKNINNISQHHIPVWRKNINKDLVTIPMEKLNQYMGEKIPGDYVFFIEKNWEERIKISRPEPRVIQKDIPKEKELDQEDIIKELGKYGRVEQQIEIFKKMPLVDREELLDDGISKLGEYKGSEGTFDISMVIDMVNIVANTFYANNANIEDSLSTTDQKENIFGVLVKTNWIIQLLVNIFATKKYPYTDYKIIDKISTGSSTIDHINKALLEFVTFSLFYNDYIDMGLVTKNIRANFKDRYLQFYQRLFPEETITIEKIFHGGMRRIDTESELEHYSIGALLYDIGKLENINYHDGSGDYDERVVKQHVLYGFNMITNAKKYPFSVIAMTAFHHEYYGGEKSYLLTKPLLSRMIGEKILFDNVKYCITYNEEDFKNGIALAYFPCKMLEIIDVYDALVTKKKKSVKDALTIMKIEFIIKSLKIDPIIFRIFLDFKLKCGILDDKVLHEIDSFE